MTGSNLIEFSRFAQDLARLQKRNFPAVQREELIFVPVLLLHTESQLLRFLLTNVTRQSARIESYSMIALLMVCRKSKRLLCASRKSNQHIAVCKGLTFQFVRKCSRFVCFKSKNEHSCHHRINCCTRECVRHPSRNPSPLHGFQTSLPIINGPIDGPSESFALIHHSFPCELLHLSYEVLVNVFK